MRPGMRRVMVGGHRDAPGVMGGCGMDGASLAAPAIYVMYRI